MITVKDLKAMLELLPEDTVVMQNPVWDELPVAIETVDQLGWHFNNIVNLSWVDNQLIMPHEITVYHPTFAWLTERTRRAIVQHTEFDT